MTGEPELLAAFLNEPNDPSIRAVYADWLEERGDARAHFLRAQAAMRAVEPDHPHRLALESTLSRTRQGLEPRWLMHVEPERAHLLRSTSEREACTCMGQRTPTLHGEPQDTECDAWRKVVECIDRAVLEQPESLAPLDGLTNEERRWIVTLPPTIAKLVAVKKLSLYGSALTRLPAEMGAMAALVEFTPYTSYRLHWFPGEIARCGYQRSTVSTRALYGNDKLRSAFPALRRSGASRRTCSVCRAMFDDTGEHRMWASQMVGTDVLPLLINACSASCVDALPDAPEGYLARPHRGGADVLQPKPRW